MIPQRVRLKKPWRRKLKKLIAVLLCAIALTLTLTASEPTKSNEISANDYGLESDKTYTSDEVAHLIDTAVDEADKAIDQAYADGYKAGLLKSGPRKEYYRVQSDKMKKELQAEQSRIEIPGWAVPASLLGGFITGFITHACVR
jgi:hypothetical protein